MRVSSLVLALLFMVANASAHDHKQKPNEAKPSKSKSEAEKAFELIRSLEGNWYSSKEPEKLMTQIRVIANGSTVIETEFPGSPSEMISIYHLHKGKLVMTHYCMLGNQPKFIGKRDGKQLNFAFNGGTNIDPKKDMHIHEGVIEIVDKNHIKSTWTMFDKGKPMEAHGFDMIRKK